MRNKIFMPWYCCQIGAREHYAIPQALHESGELANLITDAWVTHDSLLRHLPFSIFRGLQERFCHSLADASIYAYNYSLIQFELSQKIRRISGWNRVIARNQWFQKKALKTLNKLALNNINHNFTLFSYSYAALELFRFAKKQGWFTILGQIDPGICEEEIVIKEYERYPQYRAEWQPVPAEYWQTWRSECAIADCIIVNSNWSRQLLEKAGIEAKKIQVIPLVYTPPEAAKNFVRTYPESFSQDRPLRVLFLGQVILRKGIAALLEAVEHLEGYPVEFWIVGSVQITIPPYLRKHPQIRWVGHVNRSETADYYKKADVFLFPTLSDGFGITQLEAQAWKLPIIASRCCGEVVVDGVNGRLLNEVTGEAIARSLLDLLNNPKKINNFTQSLLPVDQNTHYQLFQKLQNLRTNLVRLTNL